MRLLSKPVLTRTVGIVRRQGKSLSPAAATLLQHIRAMVPQPRPLRRARARRHRACVRRSAFPRLAIDNDNAAALAYPRLCSTPAGAGSCTWGAVSFLLAPAPSRPVHRAQREARHLDPAGRARVREHAERASVIEREPGRPCHRRGALRPVRRPTTRAWSRCARTALQPPPCPSARTRPRSPPPAPCHRARTVAVREVVGRAAAIRLPEAPRAGADRSCGCAPRRVDGHYACDSVSVVGLEDAGDVVVVGHAQNARELLGSERSISTAGYRLI